LTAEGRDREDFGGVARLVGRHFREAGAKAPKPRRTTVSEERDRFNENEDNEQEDNDVEAHRLNANDEGDSDGDDVEAHRLA
jgi:hypothetical protein